MGIFVSQRCHRFQNGSFPSQNGDILPPKMGIFLSKMCDLSSQNGNLLKMGTFPSQNGNIFPPKMGIFLPKMGIFLLKIRIFLKWEYLLLRMGTSFLPKWGSVFSKGVFFLLKIWILFSKWEFSFSNWEHPSSQNGNLPFQNVGSFFPKWEIFMRWESFRTGNLFCSKWAHFENGISEWEYFSSPSLTLKPQLPPTAAQFPHFPSFHPTFLLILSQLFTI